MTRNRKADLQRKLTMAPVATPPAGLADRIKSEIPRNLGLKPESERTQFRNSAMFNLRIAASIVLLVSSLYLVLHLLSRTESKTEPATTVAEKAGAPAPRVADALPNTPPDPGTARPQPRAFRRCPELLRRGVLQRGRPRRSRKRSTPRPRACRPAPRPTPTLLSATNRSRKASERSLRMRHQQRPRPRSLNLP
jgi:hypothetical protein